MILVSIIVSVILISLISLIGVFFYASKKETINKFLEVFVSFSCGTLLGGAFFHLLPESIEKMGKNSFTLVIISFLLFFILEKLLQWRHCHQEHCEVHAFTYLNLLGDGLHNFIDGAIIAASFLTNFSLGISTSLAVMFHEIPQEIGDFSVLIYGGWTKNKALLFNFLSGLVAVVAALGIYFFSKQVSGLTPALVPFAAGGFLYIAGVDLIPELHKRKKISESIIQFISLGAGIVLMWIIH